MRFQRVAGERAQRMLGNLDRAQLTQAEFDACRR